MVIASCRASGLLDSLGAERSMLLASMRKKTRFGCGSAASTPAARGVAGGRVAACASIGGSSPNSKCPRSGSSLSVLLTLRCHAVLS